MNLLISSLDNSIKLYRSPNKKVTELFHEQYFDFSLSSLSGQLKALSEFFKTEESHLLKNEQSLNLIIDDNQIGFGTFNLPRLSVFKVKDVFDTRFKVNFPNFADYYMNSYEMLKNQDGSVFFYTICKKKNVDEIKTFFKGQSLNIHNITFFSDYYVSYLDSKTSFPTATLIVGQKNSLLIISKNTTLLSVNTFDYGENILLSGQEYLHSSYFYGNIDAKKYGGFIKENFATKEPVTDEGINKTDPQKGMSLSSPKETRILKGQSLSNYYIKNNIKKYCAMVMDVAEYYSSSPWFLPIGEINIMCSDEFYEHLQTIDNRDMNINFFRLNQDLRMVLTKEVTNNKLFKSVVKGERRKIDWAKFFTLEIGKKKKR